MKYGGGNMYNFKQRATKSNNLVVNCVFIKCQLQNLEKKLWSCIVYYVNMLFKSVYRSYTHTSYHVLSLTLRCVWQCMIFYTWNKNNSILVKNNVDTFPVLPLLSCHSLASCLLQSWHESLPLSSSWSDNVHDADIIEEYHLKRTERKRIGPRRTSTSHWFMTWLRLVARHCNYWRPDNPTWHRNNTDISEGSNCDIIAWSISHCRLLS